MTVLSSLSTMKEMLKISFKLNFMVLQCIGLYPLQKYKYLHKAFAYIMYLISVLPVFVLGILNLFFKGSVPREDFNDFGTVALILFAPKWLIFLVNSDKLQRYITYCEETFLTSEGSKKKAIIENCVKVCQRNSTIYFYSISIGMLGFFAKWYFQGYHSHLPMNLWLPFNSETQPVLYFCVYTMSIMGCVYAGMACGTIDPLVSGLLFHFSGQLLLLKENLQNLNFDGKKDERRTSRNRIIARKVKQSVVHYKDISHCVGEFEKYFSAMVFSQFMESIAAIGLICIQITKPGDLNAYSFFMMACLCIVLFQVFFYCYYGQTVLEENNTVSTAIYMSNWYEYNTETIKILTILMQRSQKPMIVTAASLVDLSLETFITVLKRSYSLIALLKNYY